MWDYFYWNFNSHSVHPLPVFPIFTLVREACHLLVQNDLRSLIRSDFCWHKSLVYANTAGMDRQRRRCTNPQSICNLVFPQYVFFFTIISSLLQLQLPCPIRASKQKWKNWVSDLLECCSQLVVVSASDGTPPTVH